MISFAESQRIIQTAALNSDYLEDVEVDLAYSIGRILAEDLMAVEANPAFDNSAMDGFAIRLDLISEAQLSGQQPIAVGGLIVAGDEALMDFGNSPAVEIMTGAPLPSPEFNCVVRVEDVEVKTLNDGFRSIRILKRPKMDDNIRRAGEDIKPGQVLLKKGDVVREIHLLSLASQGLCKLKVRRALVVAVMATGKELVDHHEGALRKGQIRNSTGVFLEATLSSPQTRVINLGVVRDEVASYLEALDEAFVRGADVIVSTGAVSMGVHDFVPQALEGLGAQIQFHKCAIRPGKPILFATLERGGKKKFIFGLPGNPVSTAVGAQFFVKPFLNQALGLGALPTRKMRLGESVKKPEGLRCFFKAETVPTDEGVVPEVKVVKGQASFMLKPFIGADVWAILPETGPQIERGQWVEVMDL